ncbi:hypothetical protein Mapa_007746 [Marchantia paleacea]|nr:hypothetical protein Mapa_007746 [Marchantia paleacea]
MGSKTAANATPAGLLAFGQRRRTPPRLPNTGEPLAQPSPLRIVHAIGPTTDACNNNILTALAQKILPNRRIARRDQQTLEENATQNACSFERQERHNRQNQKLFPK